MEAQKTLFLIGHRNPLGSFIYNILFQKVLE